MANGRCKMHGGKSTGPRTAEGIERIRAARMKHGMFSGEMRELRALIRELKAEQKVLREKA
uniref:HGGxSTG domain-containing protein n=1 Tax=Teichococcus vastitatis TaxID=2307076 RepID=UPI000E75B29C